MGIWDEQAASVLSGDVAGWALDSATDAIIVIDEAGLVRGWNRACEKLFGFAQADVVGTDVEFMIPLRLRDPHHRAFNAAIARGAMVSDGSARRTKALCADGTTVYIDMTFAMLTTGDGQVIGSVAVARPAATKETAAAPAAPQPVRKRYNGPRVDVTFLAPLCNHNGQCSRNMPEVFDVKKRPWINPTVADTPELEQRLRTTVANCPTGALQTLEVNDPDPDPAEG